MQDVCDEHGFGDYVDNVREIQQEREEIASLGYVQRWSQQAMVYLDDATNPAPPNTVAVPPVPYSEDTADSPDVPPNSSQPNPKVMD